MRSAAREAVWDRSRSRSSWSTKHIIKEPDQILPPSAGHSKAGAGHAWLFSGNSLVIGQEKIPLPSIFSRLNSE